MKRRLLLYSTATISTLFFINLGGCVNELLFIVAPLLI